MKTTGVLQHIKAAGMVLALSGAIVVGPSSIGWAAADKEATAVSLATYLRSARAVISKNQKHINDASKGDKGLSAKAVMAKARANYNKATGVEVSTLVEGAGQQAELLKALEGSVTEVMNDAQELINKKGSGFKGFLPAIFARLVTEKFRAKKGKVADIKLTAPKAYVRNRSNRPDKWEQKIIETVFKKPGYKKGKFVAEVTQKKGKKAYRLILPEYYKQSCLACHGGPKGSRDITGGKKEGGTLGELGGAISVAIYE